MKKLSFILLFSICFVTLASGEKPVSRYTLWYDAPAKNWNEALPIGNGSLGAMIFGNAEKELIQLNEETLYSGGPADQNPTPDASQYLAPARQALFEGKNTDASRAMRKMQGPDTQMYQPLGDLFISQKSTSPVTNYYRDLNIESAIAVTRFTQDGIVYTREMFVSAPDSMMVIRLKASQKG